MSDVAILVDDLSKQYRIGARQERYSTLRDSVSAAVAAPFRRAGRLMRGQINSAADLRESVWALKDINFEVKQGEVVGVIGRNGAGKSTLLKILSRITEPTLGGVDIYGRVGSLLEVGTGFHPELTGRENIFLNGAILGMKRTEITARFDEIVAFAEVDKFIDTPVKHYSSGMYLRLAFAVAAHLEPDILVIDEVLAVGDAAFQRKCLGKMNDVARQGRTVLFVSHQLSMINVLCQRAMLLHGGQLIKSGPAAQTVDYYVQFLADNIGRIASVSFEEKPALRGQLLAAAISGIDGPVSESYDVFDPVELRVKYVIREPLVGVAINLIVKRNGEILFASFDTDSQQGLLGPRDPGVYESAVALPTPLKAGHYSLDLSLSVLNVDGIHIQRDALAFEVEERSFDTSMRSYSAKRPGVMAVHLPWSVRRIDNGGGEA